MMEEPNVSKDIVALNNDSLLAMAEQAERRIDAINRIMLAALKMTNDRDWVIVGGTPYLQESGATKVARLFGISWRIDLPIYDQQPDGHFTYTYKAEFSMGGITIDAVGMRSSKDEFFTGSGANGKIKKRPEDIDRGDVMKAAYTNCINNGIKRILPGLRNLSTDDLKKAGRDPNKMKGYTFRGKSDEAGEKPAGNAPAADAGKDSGLKCSKCEKGISQKVRDYSAEKYGAALCMDCQKAAGNEQQQFA